MAGAGFKTFNTGDVLTASDVNTYLMQQTVMVFADSSARSTALGANVAEGMISYLKDTNTTAYYDGSSWVTLSTGGDITEVTAGTGLTGGGTSGAVSLAFDVANYGGGQRAAGKNKIINGDFGIWQRGTTFNSVTNGQYCADRWTVGKDGTNTVNVTQQSFTAGTAPVSGYESQYFIRGSIATTGTLTYLQFNQPIEDVRTFAGQTITVSFWAKGSASATGLVYAEQNFGSGGSANVEFGYPTYSLTTSWARYSVQLTVPSISGKTIGTSSKLTIFIRGGLTANGSTFDLWGVQVEAGSTATPFQTATGTIQGELAACQRYYYRTSNSSGTRWYGYGYAASASDLKIGIAFPVNLRVEPTSIETSAMASFAWEGYGQGNTPTTVTLNTASSVNTGVVTVSKTTSFTSGPNYSLVSNNTAAYIGFNGEL